MVTTTIKHPAKVSEEDQERILDLAEGDYPGVDRDVLRQAADILGDFDF